MQRAIARLRAAYLWRAHPTRDHQPRVQAWRTCQVREGGPWNNAPSGPLAAMGFRPADTCERAGRVDSFVRVCFNSAA